MTIQRPTIFISHIHEDQGIASLLSIFLRENYGDVCDVFCSSDGMGIPLGTDWLQSIDRNLDGSTIMLLLCNHVSVIRPWIGFEAGVGWARRIQVIPICCRGMQIKELPMPFARLEAMRIERLDSLKRMAREVGKAVGYEGDVPEERIQTMLNEIRLAD